MNIETPFALNCSPITSHNCNCPLRSACFLEQGVNAQSSQLKSVLKQKIQLKRNMTLVAENVSLNHFYMVQEGILKASNVDVNGKEHIIQFYLPGEIVGFEALFSGRYPFSIIALANTKVCELSFNELMLILDKQSDLNRKILYMMSQRINIGNKFNHVTAEAKVAIFLLDLNQRLNLHDYKLEFHLPMSRHEIASYLGLASETVIRILSKFQEAKILTTDNRKLAIIDFISLNKLAQA